MTEPTIKQWKRRALAAELEVQTLRHIRSFDKDSEMKAHSDLCRALVALKECAEAIQWATQEQL